MLRTSFILTSKKQLTHDVFELVYSCPELPKEPPKSGQYVMFQLAPGLNRAYSLASYTTDTFTLIIKRIPDGRGSPMICDAEVGTTFPGMIPLGHFILQDTPKNKCFIGTGTGFAPLYCQMLESTKKDMKPIHIAFIFGVRNFSDDFYQTEIAELGKQFEQFQHVHYFSRETEFSPDHQTQNTKYQSGYVTDWIVPENISGYEEFYLCGSPAMVKSAREELEALGATKEQIFFEQF
ncbi:MAG: FAD-dependent oxidoreductase [Candidatus Gracilibacteria bacterium]|nr:FAD-dependent oxidoreductase [Candidatus Gracilibacteria bacterium]